MDARQSRLRAAVATALLILGPAAALRGQSDAAPVGRLLPLAVRDGRCEVVLPTAGSGTKYALVVASLARDAGPYRITVTAGAASGPVSVPLDYPAPDPAWTKRVGEVRERLARVSRQLTPADNYLPAADPPRQKVFHVFTGAGDFHSPDSYVTITAALRGMGRHCLVYVDRDYSDPAGLQPTVDDVIHTFDGEVRPRARQVLGKALDVDRDGRFTILFTPCLGRMSGGKVSLGGFVRGSDFFRDLPAPFGNRCDLLYLNTDLKPGAYLHALVAHEYAHAVVFSEHVLTDYLPGVPKQEEEGWLNEGLAHLVEDLHGYSWSNLDYRVSAFLSAPERYQLVVPDYYRGGLWRSHGNRGATYLFLRWCQDRFGTDLLTRLTRTNLAGVANLEAATGEPFDNLFRQWTAALALGGTGLPLHGVPPLSHIDLHGPLGGRLLCGPHFEDVSLSGGRRDVSVAGTAAAYLLLHSPVANRSRVTIASVPGTELQVSLIRLPRRAARISLRCEAAEAAGSYRLVVTAHDGDVVLGEGAWERLVPKANRVEDTSYPASGIAWIGGPHLKAGESLRSEPVTLPEAGTPDGIWVFKVTATDAAGHHLAAWATAAD